LGGGKPGLAGKGEKKAPLKKKKKKKKKGRTPALPTTKKGRGGPRMRIHVKKKKGGRPPWPRAPEGFHIGNTQKKKERLCDRGKKKKGGEGVPLNVAGPSPWSKRGRGEDQVPSPPHGMPEKKKERRKISFVVLPSPWGRGGGGEKKGGPSLGKRKSDHARVMERRKRVEVDFLQTSKKKGRKRPGHVSIGRNSREESSMSGEGGKDTTPCKRPACPGRGKGGE